MQADLFKSFWNLVKIWLRGHLLILALTGPQPRGAFSAFVQWLENKNSIQSLVVNSVRSFLAHYVPQIYVGQNAK